MPETFITRYDCPYLFTKQLLSVLVGLSVLEIILFSNPISLLHQHFEKNAYRKTRSSTISSQQKKPARNFSVPSSYFFHPCHLIFFSFSVARIQCLPRRFYTLSTRDNSSKMNVSATAGHWQVVTTRLSINLFFTASKMMHTLVVGVFKFFSQFRFFCFSWKNKKNMIKPTKVFFFFFLHLVCFQLR